MRRPPSSQLTMKTALRSIGSERSYLSRHLAAGGSRVGSTRNISKCSGVGVVEVFNDGACLLKSHWPDIDAHLALP
jgi:hypothetical protein